MEKVKELPVTEGRVVQPAFATDADNIAKRMAMFVIEPPRRELKDLVVPEATLRQIRSLLTKIEHHHVLYQDFGLNEIDPFGGRTTINLYGPPGTGKSFAADAIANELGMDIIRANYAEIESKFVGETPKNIKAAFQKAKEANAVLFFDEADSILGKRLSNITQSTDHAVNVSRSVMLLELDQFAGVVIFATNLASNYDTAFTRRILGHIEMRLPDAVLRRRLLRYHMPSKLPVQLTESDWKKLTSKTRGLAGGDILNIVLNAASAAIERDGPGCQIGVGDFLAAIDAVNRAKERIGVSLASSAARRRGAAALPRS
jgi:ATP-dependent 26S proteasome regulatory subunit